MKDERRETMKKGEYENRERENDEESNRESRDRNNRKEGCSEGQKLRRN